jgi:chromosome segregation ATPase
VLWWQVLDKMKELNIQVENPLQFLPQDKVGQFSNLSPVDLLKHTEMAIGPEVYAQHQALMALGKELEALKQRQVSEQDGLDDLQARNKALEKDVQRFRKLQENKERRDHLQGKVMWIESEVLLAKGEEAKKEYGEARARHKAAKKEEEDKDKELGPLNAAKDRLATAIKGEAATLRRADAERASIGEKNDATADKREEDVEKLGKVDREAEKLMKAVTKAREDLEREEDRLRKEKEDLAASNPNEDPEARRVRLKKVVEERKKQHRKLQNDFKEADAQVRPLRETYDNAKEALDEAQSIHMRKRKFIADKARPAARFGVDLDKAGIGVDRAIGPLMLHIDVPEPSYQHLVEQAINAKCAPAPLKSTSRRAPPALIPLRRMLISTSVTTSVTTAVTTSVTTPAHAHLLGSLHLIASRMRQVRHVLPRPRRRHA